MSTLLEFEFGRATTVGARSYQEDSCNFKTLRSSRADRGGSPGSSYAAGLLAVLADGMGGHVGGALASETACQTFEGEFTRQIKSAAEQQVQPLEATRNALYQGLIASNQAIFARVSGNSELKGMGSTLVGVRFDRRGMLWVSVGDSPLYLLRDDQIQRLNADHSLAPMLDNMVATGEMARETAEMHPQRNALRSAVMGSKVELVDIPERYSELRPGDWIVLASDGIHSLPDGRILDIVKERHRHGAQQVADALVKHVVAQQLPHQDNTTVMVVAPYELTKSGARPTPVMSSARRAPAPRVAAEPRTLIIEHAPARHGKRAETSPALVYGAAGIAGVVLLAIVAAFVFTTGGSVTPGAVTKTQGGRITDPQKTGDKTEPETKSKEAGREGPTGKETELNPGEGSAKSSTVGEKSKSTGPSRRQTSPKTEKQD